MAMRIKFANERTAQAAANVFERYGYKAFRSGPVLVTDCPTLLAVPVVHRAVGFDRIQEVDIASGPPGGLLDAPGEVIIGDVESSTEQRRYRRTANFSIPTEVTA
jgi:hypothetical protein